MNVIRINVVVTLQNTNDVLKCANYDGNSAVNCTEAVIRCINL